MDLALARRLVAAPSDVADAWTVASLDVVREPREPRRDRVVVTLAPTGLRVGLRLRSDLPAAAHTPSTSLSFEDSRDAPPTADERAAFDALVARVAANDPGDLVARAEPQAPSAPRATDAPPTLWIAPGHLGDPMDLTYRTVRCLADSDAWAVEVGAEAPLAEVCRVHRLDPSSKRILKLPPGRHPDLGPIVDAWIAHGGDLCLFGVNEGLPVLHDPGWQLVDEVRTRPEVRVRVLGAGGALATALLHRAPADAEFDFVGLLWRGAGTCALVPALEALRAGPPGAMTPQMAFADGAQLRASWSDLTVASRGLTGWLHVYADLTLPTEWTTSWGLDALGDVDTSAWPDDAKMVVRLEAQRG